MLSKFFDYCLRNLVFSLLIMYNDRFLRDAKAQEYINSVTVLDNMRKHLS